MKLTDWTQKPSKLDIRDRIDAFMTALAGAELKDAFTICPCVKFDPSDERRMFKYLEHAMFQFLVDDPGDEADDEDDDLDEDDDEDEDEDEDDDEDEDEDDEDEDEDDDDDEDEDEDDDDDAEASPAVLDEPETWLSSLTPPSKRNFKGLQLEIEDDEVLANVFVDGRATDITARYRLKKKDGAWRLYFENFDIL